MHVCFIHGYVWILTCTEEISTGYTPVAEADITILPMHTQPLASPTTRGVIAPASAPQQGVSFPVRALALAMMWYLYIHNILWAFRMAKPLGTTLSSQKIKFSGYRKFSYRKLGCFFFSWLFFVLLKVPRYGVIPKRKLSSFLCSASHSPLPLQSSRYDFGG